MKKITIFALAMFLITFSFQNLFSDKLDKEINRITKEKIRFDIQEIINAVNENRPIKSKNPKNSDNQTLGGVSQVSNNNYLESEVHAAINPADPNNILISPIRQDMNSNMNAIQCPVYYTTNQGETWLESSFTTSPHESKIIMAGGGDPVLTFDKNGRAYLSWIMLGLSMQQEPDSAYTAIYWAYSDDGGKSWQRAADDRVFYKSAKATYFSFFSPIIDLGEMGDKQWMAVDMTEGEFANSLYASFVKLQIDSNFMQSSKMYLKRKRADKMYFESDEVLFSKGDHGMVQFGSVDVDGDGNVHVAFYGVSNELQLSLYHNISKDGGLTFENETKISDLFFNGGSFAEGQDSIIGVSTDRLYPSPYMAVDKRKGSNYVYMTWTGDGITSENGNGKDIYFARSTDNGATWQTPIVVNDDEPGKISNFYSNINVNPDGKVIITWYDRRGDKNDVNTHHFMAISDDNGESFKFNQQITTQATDFTNIGAQNGEFGIGEYNAVVSTADYAFPVWADDRNGNGDVRIYFAKVDNSGQVNRINLESVTDINSALKIQNIYPNPASDILNLELNLQKSMKLNAYLTDIQGNLITELVDEFVNQGNYSLSHNVSNLSQGAYYIYFEFDNTYLIRRINIVK